MRLSKLLQKIYQNTSPNLDKRVYKLVLNVSEKLAIHKKLTIASLGRALDGKAKIKHKIKKVDRLFGNQSLSKKTDYFYKTNIDWLIGSKKEPIIHVDWSGLTKCGRFYFLRASVPMKGRALSILDMTFPVEVYGSQSAHKLFLNRLKRLLPNDCKPIIVTDAGFRGSWFKLVLKQDWHYVGRVRHKTNYYDLIKRQWRPAKTLYLRARSTARYLFETKLSKATPLACFFYIVRNKRKGRVNRTAFGKRAQSSASKKQSRCYREPWLLVSSLSPNEFMANKIKKIYQTRMQIEEGFRDLKNTYNGFSLRHCRCKSVHRFNIALMLAAIAMLLLWVMGLTAKKLGLERSYQANTVTTRTVLSTMMIGWQAIMNDLKLIKASFALAQLTLISKSQDILS